MTFRGLKNYIDTGKVRFYSRDLPLDSLHPNAFRAAQAARCANEQGQFWTIREMMSNNPEKLDINNLVADAQQLKLDVPKFRSCVEAEKYKNEVQADVLEAMKIGADGTPAFVIGKSTPDGVDGELLVGAQPYRRVRHAPESPREKLNTMQGNFTLEGQIGPFGIWNSQA